MKRKFDNNFLVTQIINAEQKLNNKNITATEKTYLEITINKFTGYLENKKSTAKKETNLFDQNSYKKLNDKLTEDLKLISLDFWKNIIFLYNNVDQSTFEEKDYIDILKDNDNFFDMILNFYEEIDKEYYKKALSIIQYPHSLINFDKYSVAGDECFTCETLKMPFINVSSVDDDGCVAFVHELQHGIDYLVKGEPITGLLKELSPIFFENLFIDFLNEKNNCEALYNFRINYSINSLKWLNAYANILIRFDKYGGKVTKNNIKKILDVKNNNDLKVQYEKYMKIDFISCCKYMLSFFLSVELRNEYYNLDKKQVIKKLKDSLFGKYTHVDFLNLANSYNSYVEEIRLKSDKNKDYQKTVNL